MPFVISLAARRACLRLATAMAAATFVLAPLGASAQEWPTKPVRLVVGFAPGSSGDILLRLIAPKLQAMWNQPVIVDNRPGAGSTVATEHVAHATDGHTLLLASLSSLLPKFTMKDLRYDPITDLVPVYRIIDYQFVIVTNAKTAEKAKTLQEVRDLSKSLPQPLFFAGTGSTGIFNLTMAVVNSSIGIRYDEVHYQGPPAMTTAVLRNDAQLMVNAPGVIKGQLDAGELRALAAVSRERYPNLPDVPTIFEGGYKSDFVPFSWHSIMAPKTMPAPLVERIGRDLRTVLSDAEFRKSIETRLTGKVYDNSSPAAFTKEYLADAKAWQELFTRMNYKPE